MCGLCGVLGNPAHWAEGVALPQAEAGPWMRRQARLRSIKLANAITGHAGLSVRDWQGSLILVSGPTGRSEIAQGLDDLWPTVEKVLGRSLDPLDPALLRVIDG